MGTYIARRALLVIPLVWAVVTLVFVVVHLVPGNPAEVLLGPFATGAREKILLREWGLTRPLWVQYLTYLRNVATGNFGVSYLTGEPAATQILQLFPYSFELALAAMIIAVGVGTPLGILAARRQGTAFDHGALVLAMLLVSVPDFFLGLVLLLVFSSALGWLPPIGDGSFSQPLSLLAHTVLPATALSSGLMAYIARMTRTSMLGALREDYIRTARAKGVAPTAVVYRHALRNAMVPVLSIVGIGAGQVIGGAVVIEIVFARPGLGTLLVNSVTGRDYIQVQACVIVLACIFVIINLIVDVLYAVLDPRIQYA